MQYISNSCTYTFGHIWTEALKWCERIRWIRAINDGMTEKSTRRIIWMRYRQLEKWAREDDDDWSRNFNMRIYMCIYFKYMRMMCWNKCAFCYIHIRTYDVSERMKAGQIISKFGLTVKLIRFDVIEPRVCSQVRVWFFCLFVCKTKRR